MLPTLLAEEFTPLSKPSIVPSTLYEEFNTTTNSARERWVRALTQSSVFTTSPNQAPSRLMSRMALGAYRHSRVCLTNALPADQPSRLKSHYHHYRWEDAG